MAIEGTASAPSGAAVRGHARWDARRLFHEVAVRVRDENGGLSASRCELFHAWTVPVFNTTTNVTTIEWKSAPATTRRERDEESYARATKRATTVVIVGPYEKGYLITPKCRGVGKGGTIKYAVSATSSFQPKLAARLVAGVALLLVAPVVASSVTCFYTVAMTLSTLALVLIVIHRFSRAIPGGRMVKRTTAFAAFATYHFVPDEQWQNIMDMYWKMSTKPIMLVLNFIKRRYANASLESIIVEDPWALYSALTGFGLLVLGAGVGRWLVQSFVLDAVTGGVAGSVRSTVTMVIRIVGCGLIQFSSRDVPCATAMVACAATYGLYAPVVRASDRIVDAAGRLVRRGGASALHEDHEHQLSDSDSEEREDQLFSLGLRRRSRRPLPPTLDPDPRTPPRRLDARTLRSPTVQRRSFFPGMFSWSNKSASSNEFVTETGEDDRRPPVGSAAAAFGRFLSADEHEHAGRIKTDDALEQLARSPEFATWLAKNAHRVRVTREL